MRSRSSLNDLRNLEISSPRQRRVSQSSVVVQAGPLAILAQCGVFLGIVQDLRHGLHLRRVELVQRINVREDFVQVFGKPADFFACEFQVRQVSDIANFLLGDLHADAFFLACLYRMRIPRSGIPSASSLEGFSLRLSAGCGGRRVVGTRNSKSCTMPLPRTSASFPSI